jgi:hypothetical protein
MRPRFSALNQIIHVAGLVKLRTEELTTKGKQSPEWAMLMELLYRFGKVMQPENGGLMPPSEIAKRPLL